MPATPPVPALGYVRVSMAREEMISPRIQEAAIRDWADRNHRTIIDWICDLDKSGRHIKREIMGAISRIEAREAGEIIVYRYDRWGRNAVQSLANIHRVELAGGGVVSATEPLDPETAIGRYNRTNSLALAEMQSDIIAENWRAALASRVRADRLPANGGPRFGYERKGRVPDPGQAHRWRRDRGDDEGERYVVDPQTGPVLAEMYERYVAGEGYTTILAWLNGAAIRTTRGGTWSDMTLRNVLDSGFGAGLLRLHDPICRCGKDINRCLNVHYEPGSQEPVIGPELWEAYLRRREKVRRDHQSGRRAAYSLSGLLRCGQCGYQLVIAGVTGQRGYAYRCQRWTQHRGCKGVWIRRTVAEEVVLDWLSQYAAGIEAAARVAKARTSAAGTARRARERHARTIARIDRTLARLLLQRAEMDDAPGEVWEQAKAKALADRATAESALRAAAEAESANTGDYVPVAVGLLEEWETFPPSARRDLLGKLISRIVVTRTGPRQPARIEIIPVWEETP